MFCHGESVGEWGRLESAKLDLVLISVSVIEFFESEERIYEVDKEIFWEEL